MPTTCNACRLQHKCFPVNFPKFLRNRVNASVALKSLKQVFFHKVYCAENFRKLNDFAFSFHLLLEQTRILPVPPTPEPTKPPPVPPREYKPRPIYGGKYVRTGFT